MEPSIFHSIMGNVHANLDVSRQYVNSPNSNNKHNQRNKSVGVQVIINGNVYPPSPIAPQEVASKSLQRYHAVFLDNGQVYFGKLDNINTQKFVKMTDIYYLENKDGNIDPNRLALIKLGGEVHAPFDEMNVHVDRIVFWERLKDEGPVVSAIMQHKNSLTTL